MHTNFTSSALRLAVLRTVSFIQQTVSTGLMSGHNEIYHAKQSSRFVQRCNPTKENLRSRYPILHIRRIRADHSNFLLRLTFIAEPRENRFVLCQRDNIFEHRDSNRPRKFLGETAIGIRVSRM